MGINDLGQAVGWYEVAGGHAHAFRTRRNQPINRATDDLGTLGGSNSAAYGINNLGQVVGNSLTAGGDRHAFRTGSNQPINLSTDDLGTFGGSSSWAYDINDAGIVVGAADTAGGSPHAFRTAPNQPINPSADDLGTLGGRDSGARAINAAGQVVGTADLPPLAVWHAFRTGTNSGIDPLETISEPLCHRWGTDGHRSRAAEISSDRTLLALSSVFICAPSVAKESFEIVS